MRIPLYGDVKKMKNGNEYSSEIEEQIFRFVDLLKISAKTKDLKKGSSLHTEILKKRFQILTDINPLPPPKKKRIQS